MPISLGLITFLRIIISGNERAVMAIMKDRAVPTATPLPINASIMGIVPIAFE